MKTLAEKPSKLIQTCGVMSPSFSHHPRRSETPTCQIGKWGNPPPNLLLKSRERPTSHPSMQTSNHLLLLFSRFSLLVESRLGSCVEVWAVVRPDQGGRSLLWLGLPFALAYVSISQLRARSRGVGVLEVLWCLPAALMKCTDYFNDLILHHSRPQSSVTATWSNMALSQITDI